MGDLFGGGGSSTKVEIPSWLQEPMQRGISRAEQLARMGYQPYYGPEVAAFTPLQEQAMQSQYNAAAAFGMVPQGGNALAGIPQATEYSGGIRGYGSGDLFEQAVNEFEKRQPAQAQIYNSLFAGPNVNNTPIVPDRPVMGGGGDPFGGGANVSGGYDPRNNVNQFINDYLSGTGSFAGNGIQGYDFNSYMQGRGFPVSPTQGPFIVNNYDNIPGVGMPNVFPGGISGVSGGSRLPGAPVSYPEGIPGDFPDGIPTTPSPGGEPVGSADVNVSSLWSQAQKAIDAGNLVEANDFLTKYESITGTRNPVPGLKDFNTSNYYNAKPNVGLFGMMGA